MLRDNKKGLIIADFKNERCFIKIIHLHMGSYCTNTTLHSELTSF